MSRTIVHLHNQGRHRIIRDAAWKEDEHPREDSGRFTTGSGSGTSPGHSGTSEENQPHPHQEHIDRIIEQYGMKPQKLRLEPGMGEILAHASGDGITLNQDYWSDPEKMADYEKKWQGLAVDSTPEGVLQHELGHKMLQQIQPPAGLGPRQSQKWFREKDAIVRKYFDDPEMVISPYAQEHPDEWAAEAFSAMHSGKTAWPDHLPEKHQAALEGAKALWQELFAHGDREASGKLKTGAKPRAVG